MSLFTTGLSLRLAAADAKFELSQTTSPELRKRAKDSWKDAAIIRPRYDGNWVLVWDGQAIYRCYFNKYQGKWYNRDGELVLALAWRRE